MTPAGAIGAVATALAAVDGLRVHETVPGSVAAPAAVIEIAGISAPATFDGSVTYQMRVTLLIQRGDQRSSQETTYAFIDPTDPDSVFGALLDVDEGGPVSFDGPGTIEYAGTSYAGGIFTLELFG